MLKQRFQCQTPITRSKITSIALLRQFHSYLWIISISIQFHPLWFFKIAPFLWLLLLSFSSKSPTTFFLLFFFVFWECLRDSKIVIKYETSHIKSCLAALSSTTYAKYKIMSMARKKRKEISIWSYQMLDEAANLEQSRKINQTLAFSKQIYFSNWKNANFFEIQTKTEGLKTTPK